MIRPCALDIPRCKGRCGVVGLVKSTLRTTAVLTAVLVLSPPFPPQGSFGVFKVPVARAQTDVAAANPEWVIPPGQEELLADMLGRGATLPDDCKFAGADVDHVTIKTTYTCAHGDVAFQLHHPSAAPPGAIQTARFAITLQSGTPSESLKEALVARIRSREAGFQWKRIEPPVQRSKRPMGLITVIALLGVVVLGWALLRRRSRSAPAA